MKFRRNRHFQSTIWGRQLQDYAYTLECTATVLKRMAKLHEHCLPGHEEAEIAEYNKLAEQAYKMLDMTKKSDFLLYI